MKKIIFIFITMLLLPALAMAQFTGGNGRGDFMLGFSPCINPVNGGAIATAQTICIGGDLAAFTSSTPTGHTGTLEYKWQSSTTDATSESGFTDILPIVTTETYDPPGGLTTTTWYRRLAKVTCESAWVESNVIQVTVNPTRLYVTETGTGLMNGSSWANAFSGSQLQTAINLACSEVWVAAGTYKPTSGTDRTISFSMKNGVAIYGGFNGTETQLSERNWNTNVTILSGDIGTAGNNSDNSYHVFNNINNGLNLTAVLDGFTITGGNADDGTSNTNPGNSGGGMVNLNSSPSLSNVIFTGNRAYSYGGGLHNANSTSSLINVIFSGNESREAGGGMFTNSSPSLINVTFSGNQGTNFGGGLYLATPGAPNLKNCILWGNSAAAGGSNEVGNQGGTPTYTNCLIQGLNPVGTGNLDGTLAASNPLFVSQPPIGLGTTGDLRLQACSPAIDAGTSTGAFTTDILGNSRVDAIAGGNTVDMGAYEYQSTLPEINLQGGSPRTDIPDGDNTPTVAKRTDLGNVFIGGTVTVAGFIIQNTGTIPLSISAITALGGDAGMFNPSQPIGTIAAGGFASFNISFTPTSPGLKSTTIHISNSDCDEADYDFVVQATGICESPTITAPTVTQPTCTTPTGNIVVNATGSGTLEYSINNGSTWQSSNTYGGQAPGNYNIKVRQQAFPSCETTYASNPVVLTSPFTASTTTDTWTGCVSADWATSGNWADGTIPTATDDVVIPNKANKPTIFGGTAAVGKSIEVQTATSLTIASTASLTVNGSKSVAGTNIAFLNDGTVQNNGQLILGNSSSIVGQGIYNRGSFNNNTGGEIKIDNVTERGLVNQSGTFTNAAKITIGATASIANEGIENRSTFNNNTGGDIKIDRTGRGLLNIEATFNNAGFITIGASASVGQRGLNNFGTTAMFNNNTGGEIKIDNATQRGLYNEGGSTFTNAAKITIGTTASIGGDGIDNRGTFNNNMGGDIKIDRTGRGLLNHTATFNNSGLITFGSVASVGQRGLNNFGATAMFNNNTGGEIKIDNATSIGLYNEWGTITNSAKIIIGAAATVGTNGIQNDDTFNNNVCGEVILVRGTLLNSATKTFTNAGLVKVSNTLTNNGTFTNNGIINYPEGNPIPNVTNNEIIIAPTTTNACDVISPAFGLGSPVDFTIMGIFTDEAATMSAGTYTTATNTFTPTTFLAEEVRTYYVKVMDGIAGCTRILPWQLTTENCCDAPGSIWYVNAAAASGGNGASWDCAFQDLQFALTAASSGHQIWVAAGTFKPTTGTDRTLSFVMKNGVAIYGGFAGTETSLSERDWAANVTTLSGDIGTPNDNIDNSYHVVANNNNGLNSSAILDGFTISGGNADEGYLQNSYGGGILNVFSSPLVRNCRFMNNAAINGGGIYNDNSESEIINCLFTGNSAFGPGGGMSNNYSGSPLITNCTFSGNSASQGGAIVNIYDGTTPQITNCIIWGNSSGIENIHSANPTITHSIIQGGYSGIGNQNVDPLFVNATGGNLRLQACSPAINTGDIASVPAGVTTDLDGNPRFYNSGTVDMGAYEYQGAVVSGSVVYVNDDASGNNDGTSWTDAFNDLQDALALANTCSNVTEIWVAAGTYNPTSGTDRTISFVMKNGVAIYGGLVGNEAANYDLSLRNFTTNPTILSGDIDKNDGANFANNSGNSYHVISNPPGLTNSAILDGFTITGGNANGTSSPHMRGGGMYNNGDGEGNFCNPLIRYCTFQGNTASDGGGMYNRAYRGTSSPILTNCSFLGNTAAPNDGGGMFNYGGLDGTSSPILTNCYFQGNTAVSSTTSSDGGAMKNAGNSSPILTNCSFQGNNAGNEGGAMTNEGAFGTSNPILTNCSFQGNTAGSEGGGVMFNNGSHPILTNCVLFGNGGNNTFFNTSGTTVTATYSLFDITVTGYNTNGTGNLTTTTSPFVSTTLVTLNACSPAINAGNPATTSATVGNVDLAGNPRFFNNGIVDMGAYEYQGAAVSGPVVYVNDDASGNNDGTSWTDACNDLQSALTMANTCSNITEIWVASGTYKPTSGTDRTISFVMKNGVAIYGGFIGNETLLSERNWDANVTILSGDIGGVGNSDNSYHVIFNNNNGLTSSALLDGFTVTGGNANDGVLDLHGGGMFNYNSSPTVQNCVFAGNASTYGGGMSSWMSTSTITNCAFIDNTATSGGGLYSRSSIPSTPSSTLINCLFSGNSSERGGGIFSMESTVSLINCTFADNTASTNGSGIYSIDGIPTSSIAPVLTNCILWDGDNEIGNSDCQATINYSIVKGGYAGTGNLDIDPVFVNAANPAGSDGFFGTTDDGLSIQSSSPAINAGNAAVTTPPTDITGFTRTGVFDMGAYENQNPCANPTDGGTISSNQNGCSPFDPDEITGTTPTGHVGTLEYQWQSSADNITFTNITTGNYSSVNYNPGALTLTTWFKRLVKVTCESVWKESDVVKITVEQTPISGTLAKSPNATNICEGSDVSASLTAGSGGNGSDSLAYRTHDGTAWSSWTTYTSGTNISTSDKTQVEIQSLRKADYCSDATANTVSWMVDPTTVAGSIGGSSTIVYGASTGNLTLTGNTGTIQKWQKRLGTSGAYTDISHTSATYSETPTSAGTWQFRALVQSGTCDEAYTDPHSIAVEPKELTIGGSFTANDKIYDDNTDASFDANDLELTGVVGTDDVSLTGLEIDFASKTVGEHTVSITLADLDGADKDNYTLTLAGSPETTATINAGAPVKFLVTNPEDGDITSPKLHNIPFNAKVTLVDAFDNPTPNTGGNVTVTLTGSGGATPGNLRFQGFPADVVTQTLNAGDTILSFANVLYTGVSAVAGFDVKVSASASGTGTANGKTGESNLFSVRDIFFSIEADPTAILADGSSKTDITVTLEDHDNNPLANQTITVETDKGTLMEGAVELTGVVTRTSDANGQVFLDLRSANVSALATVTAKCPGACPQTVQVAFFLNAPVITGFTPGDEQVTIDFNPPTNTGLTTISNYEYSLDDGSNWTAFSPAQTGSPVIITGLTGGQTYPAKLRAVNEAGIGAASVAEEVYSCFNPTDGGEIGSDQTICEDGTPDALTSEAVPTGHFGTLEYQWQSSTTSNSIGFENIADSVSVGFVPGALDKSTWFRRLARVSCKADWTGAAGSNVVEITVQPKPVAFAGDDANIAVGEDYTLADASAENNTSVSWTTDGDGSFDDNTSLNPTYTPGDADIAAGEVELCLTATAENPCTVDSVDCLILTINRHPSISITSPADGSSVYTNPVTISGTSADADGNLSMIQVKLNSGTWQTATGTDTWTIDLNLVPGKNTILARAKDASDLYSDTATIKVLLSIQIINIPQGWSAISSYLTPQNPALPVMMDEITDNNNLVIMLSENGVYWPSQNYNTIGNWNVEQGYKVKMNNAQEFTVSGDTLASRSLSLSQGYHIIPVLTNVACPITSVFVDPLNDIFFMYDVKTNALYWPQGEIFSLTTLEPGKGYVASFNKAVTLTYPAYSGLKTGVILDNTEPEMNGPWALVRTGDVHFISIRNEAVKKLENADFIDAFDSFGNCIGFAEVDGSGDNYLLSVYGNDAFTDAKDGAEQAEPISFRSYNSSTNSETEVIAEYNTSFPNSDGLFASNGQSAIINFKESSTGIGETGNGVSVDIYPNPAKDMVNIATKGFGTLQGFGTLMTADGKLVKTFVLTGNQTQLDVQDLQAGIYILRIETAENVVIKRLVIQ